MERLLRLGGGIGAGGLNAAPHDSNQVDTSETVYISSLALLKMLKHGRAGVPMEVCFIPIFAYLFAFKVMGLMLGEFVDDYTVNVIDVFAMPQSGTVELNNIHFKSNIIIRYIGCFRRSGRSCLPSQNVGYAQADRETRNGSWLVPFSPRIWLLAFWSRY